MRARFAAARRAMPDAEREAARAAVRAAVLDRCRAAGWRCVAAYVPLRTEPGSTDLLDELIAAGVRVLVPVTLADRDLDWTAWPGPSDALGTAAIARADAVLVPAFAVATDGTRLGRGGGSYDRALPRARRDATIAAVLFDGELVDTLPREPWDVPVTSVVSPGGWVSVGRAGIPPSAR
ncbi:MAG: 5-formyltetrahydrofolate cyclo-ligase [Jatrophihabitans endophyticus]|nr:5-formyltetrahydrofolate cyclo-ligase [Jatrophihabitans endophyticus]